MICERTATYSVYPIFYVFQDGCVPATVLGPCIMMFGYLDLVDRKKHPTTPM